MLQPCPLVMVGLPLPLLLAAVSPLLLLLAAVGPLRPLLETCFLPRALLLALPSLPAFCRTLAENAVDDSCPDAPGTTPTPLDPARPATHAPTVLWSPSRTAPAITAHCFLSPTTRSAPHTACNCQTPTRSPPNSPTTLVPWPPSPLPRTRSPRSAPPTGARGRPGHAAAGAPPDTVGLR